MDSQQFEVIVGLLNNILLSLEELNNRFEKYDSEEQIDDEMLREAEDG